MIFIVLTAVLTISLVTDIKSRKILNIVTFPAILLGFAYYSITQGLEGFYFSGAGFLIGLSLLLIPYLLGGIGAGDVKLMAAVGALTGVSFVLQSFIYTTLIGGIIAATLIMQQRGVLKTFKTLFYIISTRNISSVLLKKDKTTSLSFPYGIAIAIGVLCAGLAGGIG